MKSGIQWSRRPEDAFRVLHTRYAELLRNYAHAVALRLAPEIENWMKANAPWADRTGNARQTLYTEVIPSLTEVVILLSHGVDYGIYLELRHAGRYAVISPAIDYWAPVVMGEVQRGMR